MTTRASGRCGWVFHLAAALAAAAALPWVHGLLAVAANGHLPTGHAYALAWAFAVVGWLLYRRTGWWIAWAALWAAILGGITDLPVLQHTVTYLTGAIW